MSNQLLTKRLTAEAAIGAYRIVKFGTTDDVVIQAAAVGDASIGLTDNIAPDAGEGVDIIMGGIAEVVLGGSVTRGGMLTSNATGQAVAAAPAAGVNNQVIGRALNSGVAGDVIKVLISPSTLQGA